MNTAATTVCHVKGSNERNSTEHHASTRLLRRTINDEINDLWYEDQWDDDETTKKSESSDSTTPALLRKDGTRTDDPLTKAQIFPNMNEHLQMVADKEMVFLDTECVQFRNDLRTFHAHIVALVDENGKILMNNVRVKLVKDDEEAERLLINRYTIEKNGIRRYDCLYGISRAEMIRQLLDFCAGKVVVTMGNMDLRACGLNPSILMINKIDWIDAQTYFKYPIPEKWTTEKHFLKSLAKYFYRADIQIGTHSAYVDAEWLRRVFIYQFVAEEGFMEILYKKIKNL